MSKTMAGVLADNMNTLYCEGYGDVLAFTGDADELAAALSAAGFGLVADAGAKALEDAAEEIDRLRVIGKTPFAECTDYESRAFWDFAEVRPEAWLRARATAVRGEG